MGMVKDVYDIAGDAVDRLVGKGERSRSHLSIGLAEMAEVMDAAREKFEKREIPRREGHALATLVNVSTELAKPYRKRDPGLSRLLNEKLPEVASLLERGDYYVKQQTKSVKFIVSPNLDRDDAQFSFLSEESIRLACEEMQRVAGQLSAYSVKYKSGNQLK